MVYEVADHMTSCGVPPCYKQSILQQSASTCRIQEAADLLPLDLLMEHNSAKPCLSLELGNSAPLSAARTVAWSAGILQARVAQGQRQVQSHSQIHNLMHTDRALRSTRTQHRVCRPGPQDVP